MNFIRVKTINNDVALVNLSRVTRIMRHHSGMAMMCFDGEDYMILNEKFDDLFFTCETIRRGTQNEFR